MLNLSKKEYDLNSLFSFDSLKEILLELAKSQIKLEDSIKIIQKENKERDKKILSLNKIINNNDLLNDEINPNNDDNLDSEIDLDYNIYENNDILNEQSENKEDINKGIKNHENKKEFEYDINNVNNINDNENQNLIKEKSENINKENKDENIENIYNQEIINKEKINQQDFIPNNQQNIQSSNIGKDNDKENNNDNSNKKEIKNLSNQYQSNSPNNLNNNKNNIVYVSKKDNSEKIPPSLIKSMLKQIKDQKAQMKKFEENIRKELKNLKEEETKINNLSLENKTEFNLFQEKINSLIQKNQDIEQTIETIQSDLKGLDFMRMFQDDGSGSIDATKVLVKALQEKVFKKFELVEQRYKKDSLENAKTKSNVDNLMPRVDMIKKDIEKINEWNRKTKDEFDEFVKNNENIRNNMKDNIYSDINKKIENLREEQNNNIVKIEEKINNLNNLTSKITQDFENKLKKESLQKEKDVQIQLENFKNIENNFIEFNKKISGLDKEFKSHLKTQNVDDIRKDIEEIKVSLNTKITKDDLKEIQNNIISNVNEINDLKDLFYVTQEEIKKMRNEIRTAMQKVESFQGNLIYMQSNMSTGSSKQIFDNSRYIGQNKLKEMLNPINKEIDEISKEMYSIKRDMIEADEMNKNNLKNFILKLDEENKNILKEFKIFVQKKYLDKNEINKAFKALEVQIKYLTEEKKKDSESWLLGKRSIQCFNCASCEKNINNENYTTADYLAWKKYPKGEKIHRMGQGFSHMLEMMSDDFAKNIDKNEIFNDDINNFNSEKNNNIYTSTLPNKERASSMREKINKNKEINNKSIKIVRKFGKMKLPKMFIFNKYSIDGNYISDDDNNINDDEKEKLGNIEGNPRILKIFKKGNRNEQSSLDNFKTLQNEIKKEK